MNNLFLINGFSTSRPSRPRAASRFAIGLVIATGMTIGTLFTLFVLPAMYLTLGRDYNAGRAVQPAG